MIDNRLFPAVEDRMDWAVKRQQMLSANITNLDTPGYRAKDVAFSEQLQTLQLQTTSGAHMLIPDTTSKMEVIDVDGKTKDNGNNVDLDREMSELTRNGLQYIAMIQYVSQKLKTLRTAISEGGRG